MRTILVLAALAASAAMAAPASEQDFAAIEARWAKAMVDRDWGTMDKIIAPDWTSQDERGKRTTKAEMREEFKAGKYKVSAMTTHDVHARVMGDVAVVQGGDTEKSTADGKDTSGAYTWTDVYQRRGGQWMVVASQVTPVKK